MKKIVLAFAVLSFILNGCSGDGDSNPPVQNTCAAVTSFNAVQQGELLHFTIIASGTPEQYEVSYGLASDGYPAGQGGQLFLDGSDQNWPVNTFGPGSFKFYVRTICADGITGSWSQGIVVNLTGFCSSPVNLNFDGSYLTWSDYNDTNVSQYQVEYGESGFTQGTGTVFNTNTESLTDIPMMADTAYDFYVRSNCSGTSGWSSWTGPYTYYSEYTQNMCLQPTNLTYTTLYNSSGNPWGAETSYNGNGESLFEYALMSNGQMPGPDDIEVITGGFTPTFVNLSTWGSYMFYVRGVCANGDRTPWSTMVIDI